MNSIEFSLSNSFYNREAIEEAIQDFKEFADIQLLDESFGLKLYSEKYSPEVLKDEFSNYVLGLMKNMYSENNESPIDESKFKELADNEMYFNGLKNREIGNKLLLTTETGKWTFIDKTLYKPLIQLDAEKTGELIKDMIDKKMIITKQNLPSVAEDMRSKKDFLFQGTALHIVVVTLRCNLNCIYCHASSKPYGEKQYDMDEETAKKTVDLIFQTPSKQITIEFQGGEPLLNFEIIKYIVNYAKEKNKEIQKDLRFSVVSNLLPLTNEMLNFFIEQGVHICTSLDGPKELHDHNRGAYDKTIEAINKIRKENKKQGVMWKMNALVTITRESLKYPREIIDEYIDKGFHQIHLRNLNILGCAKSNNKIYYPAEEFNEFWKKSMDYIIELNKKGTKFIERKTQIILRKLYESYDPNYTELRSPCGAIIGQLTYNYNGDVYTCDEGRMIKEDLFNIGKVDNSYPEITTSDQACSIIASSVNDTQFCDKCVYKPFCGICPVYNFSEEGSVIGNIPGSDWCKINKFQFDYIFGKLQEEDTRDILLEWIAPEKGE
ncbi:MAG: His-Xaa-Ser system radical SAM maturase HxsB [Candidatus Nanoarchaeia archaeon]